MQKKIGGVNFIFLRKKGDFFGRFSAFYGQRSITVAWATRSRWSIHEKIAVPSTPAVKFMKYFYNQKFKRYKFQHFPQTVVFS